MNKKSIPVLLTAILMFSGTSFADDSEGLNQFLANKPENLKPFYKALYIEGERNAVLNFNLLGLAAMEMGEYQAAERAFDESIKRIDSIYADDENAQKAKSIWNEEKVKDWKGEPYERAMTYFYRGLLYIRAGDFDNAAASFRAADYQDTQAEKESFQGDFGLMPYMAAWAQSCRGNMVQAKDLLNQAKTKDTTFSNTFASLPLEGDFMVVVDSGVGPYKEGTGEFKEMLELKDSAGGMDTLVKVEADSGEKIKLTDTLNAGDVYFQASTRGGRQVDGILNGKAKWKEGTNTAGDVAVGVGSAAMMAGAMSGDSGMANFGAFSSLFGVVAKVAAQAMTPAADTRYWGSLPRNIHLASATAVAVTPAAAPPSKTANASGEAAKAKAKNSTDATKAKPKEIPQTTVVQSAMEAATQKPLPRLILRYNDGKKDTTKPITFMAKNGTCGIAWARTRSAMPPSAGGVANLNDNPAPDDNSRQEKNLAFRSMLPDTF